MDAKTLIEEIGKNKIAIYGTGYVAQRFYETLVRNDLESHLLFFITSSGGENTKGYEVLSINDSRIKKDILILIAVHEAVKDEIVKELEERGYFNYIWIYPELYELILGNPIKKSVRIPVKNIWQSNRDNYCMAVRYLAIDNYYKKNTYGYFIYKMSMSLYNNTDTSEKRLQQFIALIQSWEKIGYNGNNKILISDNYGYIDGAHRISLASYFRQEYILCDIYSSKNIIEPVHNKKVIFSKSLVQELNIDKTVVNILEETNRRIDQQYGIN